MSSLGVALPLELDSANGFEMIIGLKRLFQQNLKMLILTNPGERVMDPDFGIGIKTYLFENFTESTFAKIERRIIKQTGMYLPNITINEIFFDPGQQDSNVLSVRIRYSIPNLNIRDLLEFTI